jgi:multidomain signaling protein FimX
VRMLDPQGREVLPTEFLPAAARNDLLKNIDRWVLAAALAFVAQNKPDLVFVRLAKDSVLDVSLVGWLDTQLKSTRAEPQRLCLQVTEEVAATNLSATRRLADELKERRVKFALEHFGTRSNSRELLQSLPLDFAKIDGSLMQGLPSNPEQQQQVRLIADAAHARNARTVAERIEDANTMAVVWQLGVQYIQGYLVHSPEKVVLTS